MSRYLAIFFALAALATGGWAISQTQQLAKLRADLAALDAERGDLRKKLWALEKLNQQLASRPAPNENSRPAGDPATNPGGNSADAPPGSLGADVANLQGRFMAMMDNPEIQHLMSITQRAQLDGRYSALFKNLNLSPADLEKFKNLLVEKQTSMMDVMAAARSQGLTGRENRDEIRKLVTDAQTEIDNSIRTSIGESAFAQYKNYEQTLPQRTVVGQLDQRLSYSTTPLTGQQSEQMVQILAQNAAPSKRPTDANLPTAVAIGGGHTFFPGGNQVTDKAITQSQGVLSAPQVDALRQLQQEQQAQAQLAQQMRAASGNRRGATTGQTPPSPTPPVPPKS